MLAHGKLTLLFCGSDEVLIGEGYVQDRMVQTTCSMIEPNARLLRYDAVPWPTLRRISHVFVARHCCSKFEREGKFQICKIFEFSLGKTF